MVYKLRNSVGAKEIADHLELELLGKNRKITNISSIENSNKNSLTFSNSVNFFTSACVLLNINEKKIKEDKSVIFSKNPRLDFMRCLDFLEKRVGFLNNEAPSKIDKSAIIGKNVVIENNCIIGENVVIKPNTTIHSGTKIGNSSVIGSNCSIGGDGFGFETLSNGETIRFIHLGGVIIGKNVEIGSLNSIAKGSLSDTIIDDYVRTDNLVHIAHNCFIGKGSLLTACAEISGSVSIGKNVWLGPNCSINNKISIGDNSFVGLGAVVQKKIPPNEIWTGNPAKFIKKNK